MQKSVLLAVLVALPGLIALPAKNAIAQAGPTLNVAIVKCVERNIVNTPITVFAIDTTLTLSKTTACTPSPFSSCAACLQELAHDFQCRGGSTFTSNVETTQPSSSTTTPSTASINKYVFACGPNAP
jgi:hypothetical protein